MKTLLQKFVQCFLLPCALMLPVFSWADSTGAIALKSKGSFYWQQQKQKMETGTPGFQNVTVHDPSVVKAGDHYYVFGSHLAAAKTADLMNWTLVADGVNPGNPLFNNVVTELADIFAWSDVVGLWANDVLEHKDGRFYMYPNLSRLDSPRASMGLAIADNIEGPYTYQGIFLQSGMWNQISEDGVNIYDARVHPNAVDPAAFYDREGKLWLIYGSYSGGIFIFALNPDSGLPMPDQGYGKHLMGGNHSRIEGAFVIYNPSEDYYYMFVTFGGLDRLGGYNMRVARSRNPDGPYYDAMGNDMANVKSNPNLPLFDDATIEPFGQKLVGNFYFHQVGGERGSGSGWGYVSPGHNSAFYDEKSGKYFLIFHTRFPSQGEFHQVRVHEMFINEDGWPVVAPHRYVPYTFVPYRALPYIGKSYPSYMDQCPHKEYCWNIETIAPEETPGSYKYINHGKEITAAIVESKLISLNQDGRVNGAVSGSWQQSHGNRITLDLGQTGLFKGILSRGWNEVSKRFVVSFTAMSDEGISIWGSQPAQ